MRGPLPGPVLRGPALGSGNDLHVRAAPAGLRLRSTGVIAHGDEPRPTAPAGPWAGRPADSRDAAPGPQRPVHGGLRDAEQRCRSVRLVRYSVSINSTRPATSSAHLRPHCSSDCTAHNRSTTSRNRAGSRTGPIGDPQLLEGGGSLLLAAGWMGRTPGVDLICRPQRCPAHVDRRGEVIVSAVEVVDGLESDAEVVGSLLRGEVAGDGGDHGVTVADLR